MNITKLKGMDIGDQDLPEHGTLMVGIQELLMVFAASSRFFFMSYAFPYGFYGHGPCALNFDLGQVSRSFASPEPVAAKDFHGFPVPLGQHLPPWASFFPCHPGRQVSLESGIFQSFNSLKALLGTKIALFLVKNQEVSPGKGQKHIL